MGERVFNVIITKYLWGGANVRGGEGLGKSSVTKKLSI